MLLTALLFGLLSSFHCLGMCGPIALMLPVTRDNPAKKTVQIILYHLGRISSYASLGLIFGLLGKGFVIAGMQQQISLFAGIIMLVLVLIPEKKLFAFTLLKPIGKLFQMVKNHLGKQFKRKTTDAFFSIGVFNGFLPCGLVYMALFGALTMSNTSESILYMVLFGIGTIPVMSSITLISGFLSASMQQKIQKMIPVLLVILASLFILRGLGLNIPLVSPSNLNLMVQAEANCH